MNTVEELEEFMLRVAERLAHETYKTLMVGVSVDMHNKRPGWAKRDNITLSEEQCLTKLEVFYPATAQAIKALRNLSLVEGTCDKELLSKKIRDEERGPSS